MNIEHGISNDEVSLNHPVSLVSLQNSSFRVRYSIFTAAIRVSSLKLVPMGSTAGSPQTSQHWEQRSEDSAPTAATYREKSFFNRLLGQRLTSPAAIP